MNLRKLINRLHDITQRGQGRLEAGEATILRADGKPVGVFRDLDGRLHAVSAICTHLNWELAFDSGSHAWVCPKHGARFSTDGAVLEGPATIALSAFCLPETLRNRL